MNGFPLLLASMAQYAFEFLMFATSLFLILLILVQRGRGGGLAGAFGGMGGQSAFGAKAGDLFTRITIGVAAVWILLCIAAIAVLSGESSVFGPPTPSATTGLEAVGGDEEPLPGQGAESGLGDGPATDTPPAEPAPTEPAASQGAASESTGDAAAEKPPEN